MMKFSYILKMNLLIIDVFNKKENSMEPISIVRFIIPEWLELFTKEHPIKNSILENIKEYFNQLKTQEDIQKFDAFENNIYVEKCLLEHSDFDNGEIDISIHLNKKYYYEFLSDILKEKIQSERELLEYAHGISMQKQKYEKFSQAVEQVLHKGYGIVSPGRENITLCQPEIVKHGNRYGVDIRAKAPSIHMINADIIADISPIVGTKQQAEDLIEYINKSQNESKESIWDILIFGKSIGELVDEEIAEKINKISEPCRQKLQNTLEKIINGNRGNVILVIV